MRKGQVLFQCVKCSSTHAINGKDAHLFGAKCSCGGKMIRMVKTSILNSTKRINVFEHMTKDGYWK